jgi:uncharacterized protein YkwD
LHFNLLDGLLLAVFGLAVLDGARRGFAPYATELTAFGLGLGLAFLLFGPLSSFLRRVLGVPLGLAGFGSFLIVLVIGHGMVIAAVQSWAAWADGRLRRRLGPDAFRAAGAIPALGTAMVLAAVVLSALVVLPNAGSRSLVLGSALGSTLARSSAFIQPPLHSLLVPAARESQQILGPDSGEGAGEDAFYHLQIPPDIQPDLDVSAEDRMLELVNKARTAAGLSRLGMDASLQEAARAHSLDMYRRAYFSHVTPDRKTPFDRIREQKVRYVTAGENIAFAPDVDQAEDSLMQSPDHRANILNPDFRCVGIGVYRAAGYEEMFTQDFADCS